jgi:uncharacterized protein
MRFQPIKIILLLTLLLNLAANAAFGLEPPRLKGRVNDYAGLLSPAAVSALEQKLAAFERETTNQLVLLTVPSLEEDSLELFSIRVAEAWKIGQQGKDNGILLLVAPKERKIRIEVGKGLQGVLPDITAGQITRNVISPYFRNKEFDKGITAGFDAIISATKGEFKATPADRKIAKKKNRGYGTFILLLLLGIFIVASAGSSSRTAGTIAGGVALPVAAAIGLGTVLWKLGILALLGAGAGFLISLLMRLFNSGGGGYHDSGWGGGPFFGGGFGGGSSSGGDSFSGGGGDFDGGGASDDY